MRRLFVPPLPSFSRSFLLVDSCRVRSFPRSISRSIYLSLSHMAEKSSCGKSRFFYWSLKMRCLFSWFVEISYLTAGFCLFRWTLSVLDEFFVIIEQSVCRCFVLLLGSFGELCCITVSDAFPHFIVNPQIYWILIWSLGFL